MRSHTKRGAFLVVLVFGAGAKVAFAEVSDAQFAAMQQRVADLEKKENENWMTDARASQIKALVQDVLNDAKNHGSLNGGLSGGYNNGFFLQSADGNNRLVVGGLLQFRYTFDQHNANIKGSGSTTSEGFEIRRARINFSGNVGSPDLTFKIEGDFYGGNYLTNSSLSGSTLSNSAASGAFTITDAFAAYRFTDYFKIRAGSFKAPFAKTELTLDSNLGMVERPEVITPFDPVRVLGLSLFGDLVKDQLSYDLNVNDGSKSNVFRQEDLSGSTPNLDNRLGFYARVQYAGAGAISDFAEEADLRKDHSVFIWMVGAAGGYESQSGSQSPSPQVSLVDSGLSNTSSPGYTNVVVNGNIYRATVDLSAKWEGWSILAAGFFQELNQATSLSFLSKEGSEYQLGGYVQSGYFIVPQRLELVGRAGALTSQFGPNTAEYYSLGANYYLVGHNAQIGADVSYSPDAAYSDTSNSTGTLQNTSDILFRIQFQLKF